MGNIETVLLMLAENTVMTVDFHQDVKAKYIDKNRWNDTFVVGDVHGCLEELESLLRNAPIDSNDLVLFVGDLVRKGPDSEGVVQKVLDSDNMFSVMGNNEWKIVNGKKNLESLSSSSRTWISSLPHVIVVDSLAVVHGGFDYNIRIENHPPLKIMNTRAPDGGGYDGSMWYEMYDGSLDVLGGHTVHSGVNIIGGSGCLDTGCVYGGGLSAIRISDSELFTIASEKEYVSRDRDDIVFVEDGSLFSN